MLEKTGYGSQAIEEIADRMAITDLIFRYCRSVDRIDAELGYSIWHEDAIADYGPMYQGSGTGFIDWACGVHSHMIAHSHQVTNILIQLDGEKAASESYVTVALRRMDGERLVQITARGRYIDHWSYRNGRWGIDKRVYVQDFGEAREIPTSNNMESWGQRNQSDPSYAALPKTL